VEVLYDTGTLDLPLEGLLGPPACLWDPRGIPARDVPQMAGAALVAQGHLQPGALEPLLAGLTGPPVLVVPDRTRKGPWQVVLPTLVAALREAYGEVTVLVACGLHAPGHAEELGLQATAGVRVLWHDAAGDLVEVGRTSRGTRVRLHRAYVEAPSRWVLSGLSYHYFAGFGGGPKMVFPGLAGREEILRNHGLAVRPDGRWHPGCRPGNLEGNPVAEEIREAAQLLPPERLLVVQPRGRTWLATAWTDGRAWGGFRACCQLYAREHGLAVGEPLAGVVADAGGRPRDLHLLQVHKSLQHAARFVRPGGWVLLVGACREGVGSESLVENVAALRRGRRPAPGRPHGQTAVALWEASRGLRVGLLSELSRSAPEVVEALGWIPLAEVSAALAWIRRQRLQGPWAYLREADTVLPLTPPEPRPSLGGAGGGTQR
jgi:hypothetical protein